MQTFSKIVLTILAVGWLVGCGQSKQKEDPNEKEIRNILQSFQEAYNQQDASKLATLWASDATYFNPVTGESAEGRAAIEKLFREKFAQGKKRQLEIATKSIEFPNAEEAIENGVMKVTVNHQPSQNIAYEADYARENGKWFLKAIKEIELQEPTPNEKLKDLAWLVGKWEDSDDNIEVLFDNQWDKYKNFITQHFQMKIFGQNNFEGKMIIGWDPEKKAIRSWVFDSDGEFGEGTWKKVNKGWYATMRYTLSDGRVASSKNIYTPVDERSYTFASVEREVDGEILPDVKPVTVEKIE